MAKTKFQYQVIQLVKTKRESLGLTQEDLAYALNVSRGYIGQIESINSSSRYTLDQLNTLAIFMKCSPKDFIPDDPIKYNGILRIGQKLKK